jgi:hypothetical protein
MQETKGKSMAGKNVGRTKRKYKRNILYFFAVAILAIIFPIPRIQSFMMVFSSLFRCSCLILISLAILSASTSNFDNELKSRTIENQVKLVAEELKNKMADILVKFSKNKVNNAEATAIADRKEQAWMGLGIQRGQSELDRSKFEVEADKIAKEIRIKQEHLNNEDKTIIKDCILGIGNIIARIATAKK